MRVTSARGTGGDKEATSISTQSARSGQAGLVVPLVVAGGVVGVGVGGVDDAAALFQSAAQRHGQPGRGRRLTRTRLVAARALHLHDAPYKINGSRIELNGFNIEAISSTTTVFLFPFYFFLFPILKTWLRLRFSSNKEVIGLMNAYL